MDTQRLVFDVVLMSSSKTTVNIDEIEMYVLQKHAQIEMYVCMFGPKGMCFIVKIGPYIQTNITFRIEMYVEHRKVGMYVCMFELSRYLPWFSNIHTN